VPCGGGGLLSGCAIAARTLAPDVATIGVEPALGDDVTRSFRSGSIQRVHNPATIADGARTSAPGEITFPLIMHYVTDMLTVDDTELLRAMWYLWERLKVVIEPTGALGAAALLSGKLSARGGRVGIVLSGGNADLKQLCALS
jgi:threonine dehydratase